MAVTPKKYPANKPAPLAAIAPVVMAPATKPVATASVAAAPPVKQPASAPVAATPAAVMPPSPAVAKAVESKPAAPVIASPAILPAKAAEPTQIAQKIQSKPTEVTAKLSQNVPAQAKPVSQDTEFASSYTKATKAVTDFNATMFSAMRANGEAMFDFVKALTAAKSVEEAVQLQGDHARRQYATLSNQTRELATLAQKIAADASEPLKHGLSQTFTAR